MTWQWHRTLCSLWLGLLIIGGLTPCAWAGPSAPVTIKVAAVMPEGSAWTRALHRLADEVRQQTAGEVGFTIYAGGVSGDESDVLRKMQIDRLQAAGLSGVGLGLILPKIRILEAPLLCRNDAEFDFLKQQLFEELSAELAQKGFVLLGFTEAGPVYLFGKRSLSGGNALQSVKMWAWKGDPVAERFLSAFGIPAVPLNIEDVTTGLETGMIDAFYAPPLAAIAFQWHRRVTHLLDFAIVKSIGALVMRRSSFDALSAQNQQVLAAAARRGCDELVAIARRENSEALSVLREGGIVSEAPSADQLAAFAASAELTRRRNVPDLYSDAWLARVQSLLADYRAQHP